MSLPSAERWAKARPAIRNRARWLIQTEQRPEQRTPPGGWNVWLFLAGRGAGKTRSAAEDVVYYAQTHPGARIAVVAPTFADARDTCIEGESGILALLHPDDVVDWNRSIGELVMTNGTRLKLFSGDKPARLRGPQHHRAWCDELASFRYAEAWDMLMLGLRLGEQPQCVVTTTPKPSSRPLKELLARVGEDVVLSRASTYRNRRNLAASFLDSVTRRYGGTRLGRQELEGEMLGDVLGALWRWEFIERRRLAPDLVAEVVRDIEVRRTVVAIDPAVTSGEESDETGIVAVRSFTPDADHALALGLERKPTLPQGLVMADASGTYTPDEWARKAVGLYHELEADRIVAERNQGGEMVAAVLRQVDPSVPITLVHASKGKHTRAEPVSALYEQGRVHHLGVFPDLESQMTTWVPGEDSPDRMDALVWGLTDLLLGDSRREITAIPITPAETITGDLMSVRW